jgi:molybdate transport system substrate-binding protein
MGIGIRIYALVAWFCCVSNFGFASERPITIFAAASLQNAITELAQNYTAETGVKVQVSVAGTSTLARQIQHGAPADIFISANKSWVDHLLSRNLLDPNSVSVIAENAMVLVARDDVDARFSVLEGHWDSNSLIATAMIGSVPAGIYAKEVLDHYGLWDKLQNQVVQTDNVRSALRLVELGQVDFGLVYFSDVAASKDVQIVERLPANSHSTIEYHASLVGAKSSRNAQNFYDVLVSDRFADILLTNGFVLPQK